jgi:polar amino acid transport system substrate-binding protein
MVLSLVLSACAAPAAPTTITGPDSLVEGVKVGVQLGTTGDIWLTENTKADVKRFDENPLAVQALASGDIDAVVGDSPTLADILKQNPELNLKIVGQPFTDEFYGIAIRKGLTDLKASIDKGLAEIKADGTYDAIYAKYFGAATK